MGKPINEVILSYLPQQEVQHKLKRVTGDSKHRESSNRGFVKNRAPGKLTDCGQDLAINLPGFSSYFLS